MKLGIQSRLFLAFISTTTLVVVAMALAMNWVFERGLSDYLIQVELERLDQAAQKLSKAYGENGDWEFLRHNPIAWGKALNLTDLNPNTTVEPFPNSRFPAPPGSRPPPRQRPPLESGPGFPSDRGNSGRPFPPPPPGSRPGSPLNPMEVINRRVRLLDANKQVVFGPPQVNAKEVYHPVVWQEETVGYLAMRRTESITDDLALGFQTGQQRTYTWIAFLALVISAVASLLLARRLLRPVRRITDGAQSLASGQYTTRIPVDRSDELGQLADDFNHLAATLERNEQARRQWIADISHELRTPLAILRGEIEALLDGIRQSSPDYLQSLHGEVLSLGKLVDDLYELTLSDLGALDYRRESLDLAEVIEEVVYTFERRFAARDLQLINRIEAPALLTGDDRRLRQLFVNLLENSQRYTDAGGRLEISLDSHDDWHYLRLQDTAPGVPEASLPQLFERLYRVDKSRSRTLGGAGLGLAICRNIVEAHGGRIEADRSPIGGLAVHIHLPAART